MLNLRFNACNASNHSPEREQRLLAFARNAGNQPDPENVPSILEELTQLQSSKMTVQQMIQFNRKKMQFLNELAGLNIEDQTQVERFYETYKSDIEKGFSHLSQAGVTQDSDIRHIVEEIHSLMQEKIEHLHKNPVTQEKGPVLWFNAGDSFKRAYRKSKRNPETITHYPAAFQVKNELYFDASHALYREEGNRARTTAHELAHFELAKPSRGKDVVQKFEHQIDKTSGTWESLRKKIIEIRAAEGMDQKTIGNISKSGFTHEMVSIYVSSLKAPFPAHSIQAQMVDEIEAAMATNPQLRNMMKDIVTAVDKNYEKIKGHLDVAVQEKIDDEAFERDYEEDCEVHENAEVAEEAARQHVEENLKKEVAADELLSEVSDMKDTIITLQDQLKNVDLSQMTQKEQSKHRAGMKAAQDFLANTGTSMNFIDMRLRALINWSVPGGLSLDDKIRLAAEWNLANKDEYTSGMSAENIARADLRNAEERKEILRNHAKAFSLLKTPIETIQNYMETATVLPPDARPDHQTTFVQKVRGAINSRVRFLSIMDMIKIVNVYKESIKASLKAQEDLRVYNAAQEFSGFFAYLPYGQSVIQSTKKQAKATNDEETSKFAEYIKSDGFTHDQLFDPGGILDQNRYNVNRAKAVIEYAAAHGWLYELKRNNGNDVYGVEYENAFGSQTFKELIDMNESGKEKERKRGSDKAKYHPEIYLIIDDMKEELQNKNIYAALGMMEQIQGKAKVSHSNTWALVTFINMMRGKDGKMDKNAKRLREIMDTGVLDKMGGVGIEQAAWSLTLLKMRRNQINNWAKGRAPFENNVLTRAMSKIEKKLPDPIIHDEVRDRDEAIAYILAGKTYIQGDTVISLWQPDFKEYRNFFLDKAQTSTKTASTDDDFFNPENGGSDILLVGRKIVEEINTRDSTGRPTHTGKANGFFSQVIDRYDDLAQNVGREAAEQFRIEMRYKLKHWLNTYIIGNAASYKQFGGEVDLKRRNIVNYLEARGMITQEEAAKIRLGREGKENPWPTPDAAEWEKIKPPKYKGTNDIATRIIHNNDPTEEWEPTVGYTVTTSQTTENPDASSTHLGIAP